MGSSWDLDLTDENTNDADWGENLGDQWLDFAGASEPRYLCILLLDTSQSMAGSALADVRQAVQCLFTEMMENAQAEKWEIAVITCGGTVEVIQGFKTLKDYRLPELYATGATLLGGGLTQALDLLQIHEQLCQDNNLEHRRSLLLLLTDGYLQGESLAAVRQASQRLQAKVAEQRLTFYALGVEGANFSFLTRLGGKPALALRGVRLADLVRGKLVRLTTMATTRDVEQASLPPADGG